MKSTTKAATPIEPAAIPGIASLIKTALHEDLKDGDITTNSIVPKTSQSRAVWRAKADGVIAGLFVASQVFNALDDKIQWNPLVEEGQQVQAGDILVTIEGSTRPLLTGERTALNFVQRLCGIATKTACFAEQLKGTDTSVLDTRKTLPGFRMLDKYAVQTGGGQNHRMGLYDMALIKENHITAAGGILNAVQSIRNADTNVSIEVETSNLDEVKEALNANADFIMLDNMDNTTMERAVNIIGNNAKTEASGNVTIDRLKEIGECGVDYISVGALTHSVQAFDISQIIE